MNNFRDVLFVLVQNMKIRRNEGLDFDFSSNFDVRIVCADGKPVFVHRYFNFPRNRFVHSISQ